MDRVDVTVIGGGVVGLAIAAELSRTYESVILLERHESYGKDIHREFPWISHTAPYKDPLWAFVEIDLTEGRLAVRGRKTSWVGPTPWELGVDKKVKDPDVCAPQISDRAFALWNEV